MSPMYFVYVKKWFCWRSWEPPTKWQFLWREDNILTTPPPPPPPPPPPNTHTTTPAPQHPPHPHPPPPPLTKCICLSNITYYICRLHYLLKIGGCDRANIFCIFLSHTLMEPCAWVFYYKTSRRKYNGQNLEIRIEVVTVSLPFISM